MSDEPVMPRPVEPRSKRRSSAVPIVAAALAALAAASAAVPRGSLAADGLPLPPPPPPPPAPKKAPVPLPPAPPGTALKAEPGANGNGKTTPERCTGCHAPIVQGRIVHGAIDKHDCTVCHRAVGTEAGKCRSRTASKWALVRTEPELCYGCHARKDQSKSVHTVIRQGSCLACHAAHSSNFAGLITQSREKVCFDCHDADSLNVKPVKHAPVSEGKCLDCHDAHGGNLPNNVKAESGSAFCLKCHDAKAPSGKGTPGPAFRIDLGKKVVHAAFKRTDCLGCHDGGHGSDRLKLLKKNPVDLCYGCHERKDRSKYPHTAVIAGDCAVCHDPHSSDQPKLVSKPTVQEVCSLCHQDDLTGRKVVHAPVGKGCDQCHDPHGTQNRYALKGGDGKAACYKCHKPIDGGKVKHAALERYGCTGCHDPHGTANASMLAKKVNDLCVSCHQGQQDGGHVTTISVRGHIVGGNLNDPHRPGREFSCASCHNPHGSDSPKLFYYGKDAIDSCAWCHGDKSRGGTLKNVIKRAQRTRQRDAAGAAGAGSGGGSSSGGGDGATPGGVGVGH
jgi:predicted CXXCH cytochrome family protein